MSDAAIDEINELRKENTELRQQLKYCKWCGTDYDDISSYEFSVENNLQYRWDALNYCGEECCKKGWESEKDKHKRNSRDGE